MTPDLREQFHAASPTGRIGLVGLLAFGFLGPLGPAATALPLLVLLVAALAQWRAFGTGLLRDPVFGCFLVLGAYVMARAGFAATEFPTLAADQWDEAGDFIFPALLLPVAWWLRGDPRRVIALLACALTGFCLDMLLELDWSRLPEFLAGHRHGIGSSKLGTALYTGTGLLGLIAFGPRIARALARMGPVAKAGAVLALTAAVVVLLAAQLITVARSVVLSLAVLIPLLLAVQWHRSWRPQPGPRTWLTGAAALVLVLGVGGLVWERVVDRLMAEAGVLEQVAEGDLADVPYHSMGARVHLWHFSAELIRERPLFGWGPGTHPTHYLAPRRDHTRLEMFGDLHNQWIDITARLGLTGLAIYAVLLGLFLHAGIRSWRAGDMPRDVFLFLAASVLLIAGWSMINGRLLNHDFQYFMVLVLSVMYTFDRQRQTHAETVGEHEIPVNMTDPEPADPARD